jgi:hypothetical protein
MCCKVFDIDELAKPANQWCSHFAKGVGCVSYSSRPGSCREFRCHWLMDLNLGEEWKPNVAKFVLTERLNGENLTVTVDEGYPTAWRRSPYYEHIIAWTNERWLTNRHIVVAIGDLRIALFPQEELQFTPPDGSEFMVGYREVDGKRRPLVQIRAQDGALTDILGNSEIGFSRSRAGHLATPLMRGLR